MRYSTTRSKAIQLSAVLTLSAIVSGCATPSISAVTAELSQPLKVDDQEILHDGPGESVDYYQDQQRFFDSEFDYDDAAILARYWGESVDDSKTRIGDKLEAADGVAIVNEILEEATRETANPDFEPLTRRGPVDPNRQAYLDSSFDYFDAEQLAIFWGLDIDEAKSRIGSTLLQDEGFDVVTDVLREARWANRANNEGDELGSAQPSVEDSRQAYFESDFSYDDALVLSAFWGEAVDDTKIRMGNKIIFNGPEFLNEILEDAEREAADSEGDRPSRGTVADADYERNRDAYFSSDYTYNDAELLADYWGMDINDTKARMGSKILRGSEMIQGLNDYLEEAEAEAVRRINVRTEG